ncbi:MAG: phospholipase [Thaumarchaeota archaeon]|nr:phospholipase [Nitrososphaerota archaeon]
MPTKTKDGLTITTHVGDGSVLLAFDIDTSKRDKLAGFSIYCKTPKPGSYPYGEFFLNNPINFEALTSDKESTLTPSDKAPFQTFHWIHFPGAGPGTYQYTIYASYFDGNGTPKLGQSVCIDADLSYKSFDNMEVGFTRGYISSQAYATIFKNNMTVLPEQKSLDFDMSPNKDTYSWLGSHGRKLIYDFLDEAIQDNSIKLDMFAYDFDEPVIIKKLQSLGNRLSLFQDDYISSKKDKTGKTEYSGHGIPNAIEMQAVSVLAKSGAKIRKGHFGRFSHDKVMIQIKNGQAIKVLTGSANFSMRGLYVQANSILVFNESSVASLYKQAFDETFTDSEGLESSDISSVESSDDNAELKSKFDSDSRKESTLFKKSKIALDWFEINNVGLPRLLFAFSPHAKPQDDTVFTLKTIDEAVKSANSSVLFALMATSGAGPLIGDLQDLENRDQILSLGTTQNEDKGFELHRKGLANTAVANFSFLKDNIPEPFKKEWQGGRGQVIHHKFVVCDFNDKSPVVFCGSSNLSEGGEENNGDNLIAIYDRNIATYYAVEAIRLFDHYRFRDLHEKSQSNAPLTLKNSDQWADSYFIDEDIKSLERSTLVRSV